MWNFEVAKTTNTGMNTTKNMSSESDNEILFSKTIKAGQRIYYVDVKKNKRDQMYLCITESKKTTSGPEDAPHINYDRHKIFLFQEDFEKFNNSLSEAILFIQNCQGEADQRPDNNEIKIDMEF